MRESSPVNPIKASWRWLGYWGDRLGPIVPAVSVIGTTAGGASLALFWQAWFIVMVAALLPLPGAFWRKRAAGDEDRADARERLMEESLPRILELAASATSEPSAERRRIAESIAERVATELKNAFDDVDGVRVVVFRVSDDGTEMVPSPPSGRHDRPRPFVRGTARGDKAFGVLEGEKPYVMVEDLEESEPGEWAGTGDGYSTFITAPIRSSSEGFGLLTLDAPEPGTLDKRHGTTLALFASAVGVFFAEATRNSGRAR